MRSIDRHKEADGLQLGADPQTQWAGLIRTCGKLWCVCTKVQSTPALHSAYLDLV